MGPIVYFKEELCESSFGEPDEIEHPVELLEGNGHMILRVQLADGERPVDLLFTEQQAVSFSDATQAILTRLGLDKR